MSKGELSRVEVLARVRSGQLRVVDAAVLMRVSYRQAKRLWKRYRREGAAGLKHRNSGRASNRAYAESFRCTVLRLVGEKYGGAVGARFGPTLAAEHLTSEDGIRVSGETLRRWMLAEGLWSRERIHGTHQDRLVKKLRRKQIRSHAEANRYLEADYLEEHNGRFARVAARREDYHRRAPGKAALDRIFRLESERVISEDWVVRYENRFFQLEAQSRNYAPARSKVVVWERPEGQLGIEYRGRAARWREIPAPARPVAQQHKAVTARKAGQKKWVPPRNHPWREAARRQMARKARKQTEATQRRSWDLSSAAP